MSSNQTDASDGDSNESKGGSKLDSLSRDDLIKFVKKQMVLLQKSKSHCDELSHELSKTKEKLKKQTDVKTRAEDADDDADERENLIKAYNASQTALEESASKIAGLTEQVNCLQQKNETLTALYQCMQTEIDTLASRNKELENSLFLMSEARDEAVKQLSSRQTSGEPSAVNADQFICSNCGEMKTKTDEMTTVLEELKQKIESLEPVEAERDQLKRDLSQSQEKLAKAAIFIDKLKKERQQLKEQKAEVQTSQSTLSDLQEALDTVRQELIAANEEKLKVFKEMEKIKTDLAKSLGDYEKVVSEKAELVSQLADHQKAFDFVKVQFKDVQNDRDMCAEKLTISQKNLDDMVQHLASLQEEQNSTVADSVELQKSLDVVKEKLEAVTNEKQVADEELEKLREKLVETAQVSSEMDANAKKLQDAEELLSKTKKELSATETELESEKMRNKELEERVSHLNETREEMLEPISQLSGEAGPVENAVLDDLVRELHQPIDQLKTELELHTTNEQEVTAMNKELRNRVKELELRIGKNFDESKNLETDGICCDASEETVENQPEEEAKEQIPIDRQLSLLEKDALRQEQLLLREKLTEWETMMQMLQTERDVMEREITRMGERERRDGCLLEEILLVLQNALQGRDLFHDQTKMIEDNGALYAKLCLLQSIVDEMNFERDEMREKIQHLTEQVTELEKCVSETAGNNASSSRNGRSKNDDRILSEELDEASGALQEPAGKEKGISENESIVNSLNKKIEALSEEVVEWKQLLEVEKTNSKKWEIRCDEMQGVVEGLIAEKEQLEKKLLEAMRAVGHVQLESTQPPSCKEEEHAGEIAHANDNQTHLDEAAKVDTEAGESKKKEWLMTEQVKQKTVKKSRPLVIQVLLEDEKLQMLEENRNLREEIQLLKKQLDTSGDHSTEMIKSQAGQLHRDDVDNSAKEEIGDDTFQDTDQAEKVIRDSSVSDAADETGGTLGDKDTEHTLEGTMEESADVGCLLQEKRDELHKISEEINTAPERSVTKAELERLRKECSHARAEFEVLLQTKNSEIERLQAELIQASKELEKNQDHETMIITLRKEIVQLRKEEADFNEQKEMLVSEVTNARKDAETISYEKNAEIQRLKEEHHRFKIEVEARVEEYKHQLQIAVEESGRHLAGDADQMSHKDAEIRRLEDLLTRLREETESCIKDKDNEIDEVKEKLVAAQGELEDLNRELNVAQEEGRNHHMEILDLKSELGHIQDEAARSMAKSNSEFEELKAELVKVQALADGRESQLDKSAVELCNLVQEMDEKNQTIKKLQEDVLYTKQNCECEVKEKNTRISDLEDLLDKLRKDSEASIINKDTKIKELEEELQQNLEGHFKDKDAEIESLRVELLKIRDQTEGHIRNKDNEIERLKMELFKIKEDSERNAEIKESETERLVAELKVKTEFEENVKVRDVEIENLKLELIKVKAEFEDLLKNKDCEIENLKLELVKVKAELEDLLKNKDGEIEKSRAELLTIKEGSQNLTEGRDQQIDCLQEQLLKLKEVEGQFKVIESQLWEVEGQLREVKGQLKDKNAVNERLEAQLVEIREQNENLIRNQENEIQSVKDDLEKSRIESDNLVSSKDSEIRKLLTEIDCIREESRNTLASRDTQIEGLEKRLEAFQNEAHNTDNLSLEMQKLQEESDRMRLVIEQRESEIEQLKEEVARGKNLMESSFERKENDQMETSSGHLESSLNQETSSLSSSGETVAVLEQRLKEREERENKLKQLTLKAKKESADLRAKLTACQKDLDITHAKLLEATSHKDSNQSIQFQSLQTEYEKLESLFEGEKSTRLELQKSLKQAVDELSNVKVSAAELTEEKSKMQWDLQKLERGKKELETLRQEKEQEVQAERIQREQMARDRAELEKRVLKAESQCRDTEDELKMEIRHLQDQLKAAKQELDFAKTEIQQTSMMDLEIADYERAVKTLHETVADRDAKLKTLQEEVEQQQEQRTALQKLLDSSASQYTQLDDHCNKLKQLLVKSKKDLAEAKKLEGEQRTVDAQLRGQLERLTQLTEEQKLQISSLVAENKKQGENLRLHSDSHQRTAQSMEQRVQSLEHDLQVARSEMAAIQAEYDSYKVRAHSVLKHQKTRSNAADDTSVEQERLERQQLEKFVESLKTRLADVNQQMSSVSSEYELLQQEHERLQTRHSKLIAEMEANERAWRDRLEKVNAESSLNSMKKVEVIQQLTMQSEVISSSYKDQIQSIQEEHKRVVESLRQQLETAEIELDRYHARFQNMNQNLPSNSMPSLPVLDHETSSDRVLEFVKELRPEERQSGEGSETVDDNHVKMSSAANHSLLPFEQLLDSTQVDDVMSVKTMESTAEEMMLKASLASSEKRIEHLTQILNESEATVLRLTEQASILKGEIRRMERNQERETAISNMEYLKNVVYKFLTLKSGDERLQLIPVLTTMLKFSPDEKDKMTAIAAGSEGAPPAGQDASGWSAYLHRWSGLV